ncbi:hypothetical protein SETIT_7G056100v2 [Setaria italica]|uniref:Receptor-like serine/threonine-protein kinase n=1 Tax=Setaria italica TaxID=4555 RepID=A0A368RSJ9_SETIT|nr:G-type lectin S-receptor-like serine/threonine-protein kinase At2g19130 [Setaria italica]RCV33105.1 hypothetical protein SETIT_7G056100v2 [Setaria italica]
MPTLPLFLGLLLFSLHTIIPPSTAAKDDTLAPGQVLTAGEKLVSSNGKFALGFFQPDAGNNSKSSTSPGWYLAVWFNKIPLLTPVWVANREMPIADPDLRATKLQISGDGNLAVVSNHSTQPFIWSTHITNNNRTSNATTIAILLATGNLVVQDPSSSAVLWQSFDDPTDVALPGAKIGWNKVTGLNRVGISWKSRTDPGLGSFSVGLETNGTRRVMVSRRVYPSKVYWSWSPDNSPMQIPALKALLSMNPQTSGLVVPEYVDNDEEEYYMYTSPDESSATFLSLDTSGQTKLNVWSQAEQSWHSIYVQPVDPCRPYATCGPFTVCTGSSPSPCECMESFSLASPGDWELGDRTGGCSRNTPLDCNANRSDSASTDVFHPIASVTLPYGPKDAVAATRSECEWACRSNCSCTAYSFQGSKCSVWHGELFSVNKNDGIEISSQDTLYIRLAAGDFPRGTRRRPVAGVVIAASVIGFGLIMLMMLLVISRNRLNWCGASSSHVTGEGRVGVVAFRYADLGRATKNFSEKLGAGGFGSVFKGVLGDLTAVAVKRLDGARQGEKQFRAEVGALGLIQHINLVKLIGFCCQGDKRLLVYEHMCNGSLDSHLFQSKAAVLDWSTRYQIAIGVARGLSYLHQSCRECIIHCDIKPENVLLNESFVPKIADFGLASVVGRDFSRVLTTFRGTMGYLAPEWLSGIAITSKVDVYSFGMVLMEIISGRRNASVVHTSSSCCVAYFPVQAISKLHEGDVQSLVDPELHGDFSLDEAERVCKVACWCIQDNESDRPTMGEVVRVLEGLQELDMPPMPRLLAAITESSNVASMYSSS